MCHMSHTLHAFVTCRTFHTHLKVKAFKLIPHGEGVQRMTQVVHVMVMMAVRMIVFMMMVVVVMMTMMMMFCVDDDG